MNISTINNANIYQKMFNYGFEQENTRNVRNLYAVQPINKISGYDILDIDFGKVAKYSGDEKTEQKFGFAGQKIEANNNEEKTVQVLEERDAEVRTHEQAHISAGGGLVRGGAMYNYTTGPDGKQYAVGGEVNIDMSMEDAPEKTISKMQRVISAAMAPAEPSAQDYSVAAAARKNEAEARRQLSVEANNSNNANINNTSQQNTSPIAARRIINTYSQNKNYNSPQTEALNNFVV